MIFIYLLQSRLLLDTLLRGKRTSFMETAPCGKVQKIGRRAGDGDQLLPGFYKGGKSVDQPERVRMVRTMENGIPPVFHDLPGIHDRNFIAIFGDHRHVMGDQQHGLLQLLVNFFDAE